MLIKLKDYLNTKYSMSINNFGVTVHMYDTQNYHASNDSVIGI